MTIKAGTKTLTFLEIAPKRTLKKKKEKKMGEKSKSNEKEVSEGNPDSIAKESSTGKGDKTKNLEPKAIDSGNSSASLDP